MIKRQKLYKQKAFFTLKKIEIQLLSFILFLILIFFAGYYFQYFFGNYTFLNRYFNVISSKSKNIILENKLYQDKNLLTLYHFSPLTIPPGNNNFLLVGDIEGSGVIHAIVFHTNYYGVGIGYQTDNNPIIWVNNGHCLKNMKAYCSYNPNLSVCLLYYHSRYNLSIFLNTPLFFNKKFKLYFTNSYEKEKSIDSLHVYLYGSNIKAADNNLLLGLD